MATSKHPAPLTAAELDFWQAAFLAAELPVLWKGRLANNTPEAVAHIAREYADAAVAELRNAKNGARS